VAAAAGEVDWPLLLRIARRHRVEGLVWQALAPVKPRIPAQFAGELREAARRIGRANIAQAAESVRLFRGLEAAGIPVLFLKGVSLGLLAYGDIAIKASRDIDLLVPKEQLFGAADAMQEAGYRLLFPASLSSDQLRLWHAHSKESVWAKPEGGALVELHTALADNPLLIRGLGCQSPRQAVEVAPGLALPTLARDELFAYLCVHGATSAWFRLKWIADIAALVAGEEEREIERLHRRSVELGAGRASASALLLGASLFGTRVSAELERELRADRVNRWMHVAAMRKLTGRTGVAEVQETRLGTASIHLLHLGLKPGWRFALAEFRRKLISPVDVLARPLPKGLHFLYPALQAWRLLAGR
jgi:hypothetical protein